MRYLSLSFNEDLHRDDVHAFKMVRGCLGVSAYRNTINLYFQHIDRVTLRALAEVVQRQLVLSGADVSMRTATLSSSASTFDIYAALRDEAAV